MPKGYHHLTYSDRCQLYALKKRGESLSQIAEALNVHKSTISRELKRNQGRKNYRFKQAHRKATARRSQTSARRHKMSSETINLIEQKLWLQWSPEQIAGWLKKHHPVKSVSHEAIYQHIWRDRRDGGILYKNLRHNGKKYNKRGSGKAGRGCIPDRVDIKERPAIVEQKCRIGDWELDTIIGKGHQGAIVSMVDRASKLTKLVLIPRKTAQNVQGALLQKLTPIQEFVLTLTADNGKEFASHKEVSKGLSGDFFFAAPYHSWERGLNEHTNGLVRQYFPKSLKFNEINQSHVDEVEDLLNNRPRKVLDYQTPIEAFAMLTKRSQIKRN